MIKSNFDSEKYLQRIGFNGDIDNTFSTLKALHKAHLMTIPFENFDIQLGRGIDISDEAVFKKIVLCNRGGYCYETNGLFLRALKHFGFNARALMARVHTLEGPTGRGHQITLVKIDNEEWIVDLGFGAANPSEPLPLVYNSELAANEQHFKLLKDENFGAILQIKKDGEWSNLYSTDFTYTCHGDRTLANHYSSTHPASLFVTSRVAALRLEGGEITLLNNIIKHKQSDNIITTILPENDDYISAIEKYFNISLNVNYSNLRNINV